MGLGWSSKLERSLTAMLELDGSLNRFETQTLRKTRVILKPASGLLNRRLSNTIRNSAPL